MPLIDVGQKAPNFALRDQHGEKHSLEDYSGRSLVVYFYPKDDTSGCTAQACQFRDLHPDFAHIKAAVLGISPDDEASHLAFHGKHALGFPLLVDARKGEEPPAMCAAYGVWEEKTMYGRTAVGVVRTTYLIDAEGRVARRWDRVKVPGHGREVLHAVKELIGTSGKGGAGEHESAPGKRSRSHDSNPPFAPIRGGRGPGDQHRGGQVGGPPSRIVKQRGRMK